MGELWTRGKILGRGSYGVVSLAETNGVLLPPLIAVKSCILTQSQSLQEEQAFLQLFQNSSYVIRCFRVDITTTADNVALYNLLLEYASGGSLGDRLDSYSRKGIPDFEVRKHTKNLLLGLSEVHAKGIVHCDVKPQNILLVDGVAKIADFGLAMTEKQSKTENHGLRGTALYLAPESVANQEYGTKVDIWALGCTVYELITGAPLWGSYKDAEDDVLDRIVSEEPNLENSKLSEEERDFLKKCLVKDPDARWTADMLLGHPFARMKLKLKVAIAQKPKQCNKDSQFGEEDHAELSLYISIVQRLVIIH